ncbi:MAG: chitobiase/beta-hexosaminidase C-terminal domain-containing protein [Spirochaetia bacterium]|jgi:hypothetical protein
MKWHGKSVGTVYPKYKSARRVFQAFSVGILMIGVALLVSCPAKDLLTNAKGGLVATPQFDPAPLADGTYSASSDFTVTITCATSGAMIHYTTDNSTPSVSTPEYTAPISVAGNGTSLTIKAVGTKSGMTDSGLAQGIYKVNYTQVSTPQFDPTEGTYTTDQSVTISTTTLEATIYYTSDGSDPTTSATKQTYSTAITITGPSTTKTIKAYATNAAMSDSTVGSATYTVSYPTYTVSYIANGASGTVPVDSRSYLAGQTVTVLDRGSLLKSGNYNFIGWNTALNGSGTKYHAGSTFAIGSANVTLYAQWPADLVGSDGAASDYFGRSVAVSGDGNTAVIGAYYKNSAQGEAYVFTKSGSSWNQAATLFAVSGATYDCFGFSVAISNDGSTVVIGAWGTNTYQGEAYVFTGTSWSTVKELTVTPGAAFDYFGYSVAVSSDGSTAVIGAINANTTKGEAYVFTKSGSTWSQTELIAGDGVAGDQFGCSVAISSNGGTVVIGAMNANTTKGEAYVYNGTSWGTETKLKAADGASGDQFGYSVSVSSDGSTLVIGAISANTTKGEAYVYNGTSWGTETKLFASDGTAGDQFGCSVSASGDGNTAVIGAYGKTVGTNSSQGAAYVFTSSGSSWTQTRKLTTDDGAASDNFGFSVTASSDGSTLVIGAYNKTIGSNNSQGAAYAF